MGEQKGCQHEETKELLLVGNSKFPNWEEEEFFVGTWWYLQTSNWEHEKLMCFVAPKKISYNCVDAKLAILQKK